MLPFYGDQGFKEWIYQVAIAADQFVNAFFNGKADETMSSRCYRLHDRQPYKSYEKIIDAIFYPFQGPGHCHGAYQSEINGKQRPVGVTTVTNKSA
jgi:hypothetical protein